MERVYDNYASYNIQGACYKYIHKCPKCGEILFEVSEYDYNRNISKINIPNFCYKCGTKRRGE